MAGTRGRWYALAAVVLSAVIVLPVVTQPAAADPISDAQAQASALVAQIAHMGTRIHQLTESYNQANQQEELVATQIVQDRAKLDHTQRDADAARTLLRQQAVNAYTNTLSTSPGSHFTTGNPAVDALVRREYLSVATGTVSDTIDRLRADLATLRVWGDQLRGEQRAQAQVAEQAAEARRGALAEAARAESALAQVRGRLTMLVAQAQAAQAAAAQAAARQAAAAAAARQAAAAAARTAASRPAAVPPPPRPVFPVMQGLPVNGGLLSVVRAAVGAPPPAPRRPAPAPATGGGAGGPWASLRQCESSGNYATNTGNGFFGAYQFVQSTWSGLGFPGRPDLAPPAMQDAAAQKLQAMQGWSPWPTCSATLGLR